MNKILSLAYSPCPNDTFIFYALAHNLIDCGNLSFDIHLSDIETLNQKADKAVFDITKLSFAALAHFQDKYSLINSGSALGRGCGPLIVAREGADLSQIRTEKIAVPGIYTTAYLLLSLYLSENTDSYFNGNDPAIISMPFNEIMPAVSKKDCDFGIIIHEGRFTYKNYGLVNLLDLGEWWEDKTSLPIPLGGIAVRRDIPFKTAEAVEKNIRESINYAFNNRDLTKEYIKKHAQEIDDSVILQHIELYVNNFSLDLGREGRQAIDTLFGMAMQYKIIPETNLPLFVGDSSFHSE